MTMNDEFFTALLVGIIISILFKWFGIWDSKTKQRVEKFKKDLNKPQKGIHRFNVLAFIFSSFVFWDAQATMFWWFILFFILPWILMLPFLFFINFLCAFIIGLLISHTIAGFVAKRILKKRKESYIAKYKDIDLDRSVLYRPISIKKLLMMNVLTVGLYSIYWSFINWSAYKKETKDDINPYAYSLLCHLTMMNLFSKITKTVKSKTSYAFYGWLFFVLSYLEGVLLPKMIEDTSFADLFRWLCVVIYLLLPLIITLICFVPIQKEINFYAKKQFKQNIDKHFYVGEFIFLILGLLANYCVWFGSPFEEPMQKSVFTENFTEAEQEKIGASLGFIYRHVYGYTNVCAKENYKMQKYPHDFIDLFNDDIERLRNKLNSKGISLENAMDEVTASPQFSTIVHQSIYAELEQLNKAVILQVISEENNIPLEDLTWNDELDYLLNFQDICELFDERGINIIKENRNLMYYLKANF